MGAVIFEKRNGKYDAMFVARAGGVDEVACPKQRPIPHDMIHYAVESTLAQRGFLNRFAAGEGAGFRMAPEAGSESVERLVETLQADSWSGRPDPADVIDLYHTTCAARGDAPLAIDADIIATLRAAIDALAVRWDALPVGGRLELTLSDH